LRLETLGVERFRALDQVYIQPSADVVLFYGDNGAGKTSMLEAISFLATGRSFLGTRLPSLIQTDQQDLLVTARVREGENSRQVGLQRFLNGQSDARIDGERVTTLSALAHCLPFLVVGAEGLSWLAGTPARRRSILDWGVFHVEQLDPGHYSRYRKALEQRNKALKNDTLSASDVQVWDAVLAEAGEAIVAAREAYVARLIEVFQTLADSVEGLPPISLSHQPGYSRHKGDLLQALKRGWSRDRLMGSTYSGPHRGDLSLVCRGAPALESLSRGQQKVLVALLVLAQQQLLWQVRGRRVLLLVDDLAAELDDHRQAHLWQLMTQTGAQVFLTSVDARRVQPIVDSDRPLQMFHVKNGSVTEVEAR